MCRFVLLWFLLVTFKEAQGQTTQVTKFTPPVNDCIRSLVARNKSGSVINLCHIRPTANCVRSNGILPINAYVVGCIEPPCILPQLEDVVINVVFEAPYLLNNLTTKALAILSLGIIPIEVNYDLKSNAITCNFFTNTYCPVVQKEVVQYTLKMFIESFFPAGTSATIEFRVETEDAQQVWCIRVPIKIIKPILQADINKND